MEARYETERRERAERDLRDERSRSRSLGAVSSLSRRVLPSMASAIAEREGAESSDPLAGTIECSDSDWDENAKGICNLQDQVTINIFISPYQFVFTWKHEWVSSVCFCWG